MGMRRTIAIIAVIRVKVDEMTSMGRIDGSVNHFGNQCSEDSAKAKFLVNGKLGKIGGWMPYCAREFIPVPEKL